jgi:hypothetical protein
LIGPREYRITYSCAGRHIQKSVPFLLKQYDISEPVPTVRANIKREFLKLGTASPDVDTKMVNMLIFKGQVSQNSKFQASISFLTRIQGPFCNSPALIPLAAMQLELDEALAMWKTRTHILRFVSTCAQKQKRLDFSPALSDAKVKTRRAMLAF